ncbi:KilA-N domain-containing protein [Belnapia sp. T18]|uniref:KilA-N domain-containing protein n=1 Tax=Belnapia arida TaxID=2804533 RepID=A0ABS1U9K3_9PROT|nr:KilA-N domain-containing protein [Belnapia arida]MBL6081329.1 KilA-N domain-containing protein [Belnapia arida]
MTPISALSYQGRPIRLRGAMLNLTDMWQAAGGPENRHPAHWLILNETQHCRAQPQIHWIMFEAPTADTVISDGSIKIDGDGLVATLGGHHDGTWAHWQLALSYARYLSPRLHLWCNTVVRTAIAQPSGSPTPRHDPLLPSLAQQFRSLHRRLDILDRHAADLMFLQLSAQDLLLGKRRDFSERSQAIITRVAAAEPFNSQCPCCDTNPVLTEAGRPLPGAEFDHFFHRGLNRPEHGWLVCAACHGELTRGSYLVRFARMPEFRTFQAAVLKQRRRGHPSTTAPMR